VPNLRPFEAIKKILLRSSSATNQSSSFVFFANQGQFNFVTLEGLANQPVVAFYTNDIVINNSIYNVTFRNLINYVIG
jgi:hypothetical protein